MASVSEPVTFREFCPLYYLLNAIPTRIQKGFRSLVVYLTALDTNGDYIAVGSSIGMLYLYCRQHGQMRKYNFEGRTESITVVKLLSCFDDLVAAGTASGRVAVFQLVSSLPGRNKQLRRFDVTGIHKNSITALAWSPNGMKLFSGDDKGKIVYSSLDLDQGVCRSHLLLEEPASIVQLDYSQKVLLVSTLQRSLLFHTEERSVQQVGAQPRRSTGKFGACFIPGLCKQSDLTLYASRPGLRLWKADIHGTVQATFILKDVFAGGVKPFELYPRLDSAARGGCSSPEKHLGLVSCFFQEGWVLSWNEYSIYLLDTVNQATIAGLEGSGDIVSVSCTENEIFFLKGDRNIIRISSRPEGLASIVKPASLPVRDGLETSACSEQVHGPRAEKLPAATPSETRLRGSSVASSVASEPRSRSSSLNSTDSGSGPQTAPELGRGGPLTSKRFSVISSEDFDQELVVKPLRVKKKKRTKKTVEGGSSTTGPSSLESTPGCECPGDSPQSVSMDLPSVASSLGSIVDRSSTGSPDQESSLSGEAAGVLPEYSDPEAFSVLEVPLPAPDLLNRGGDRRAEIPLDDGEGGTELPAGVVSSSWHPPELVEGSEDIVELEEEPRPADGGPGGAAEARRERAVQPDGPQGAFSEACILDSAPVPSHLSWAPSAEQQLPGATADEGRAEEPPEEQGFLTHVGAPHHLSLSPWHGAPDADTGQTAVVTSERDLGGGGQPPPWASASAAGAQEQTPRDQVLTSSDEEDIYGHGLPSSSSETSVTELGGGRSLQDLRQLGADDPGLLKADQFAESWMGYSGPGHGILSLAVSEKYLWCLDYKGGLFCSALPGAGLRWQKFEDAVQQIEQKSNRAFACGKVTIKGKRHWYEALPQAVFVALSDDTAWIIRTNGDLYLQTGLSVDRPCARAVKVDCPFPLSQVTARNSVVWALTEQRALLYREGVSSFCPEGEQWKCDIVSERQALEPVCITLGDQQSLWALDIRGNLWFRTGVVSKKPQGDDGHWWQVSITDYVVFDQCSLFQTIIHATHSVATAAQVPVEKVADRLRTAFWSQQLQCQPSLLGVNNSGVWISSGKNEFHVARGNLIGTYWNHVVPRGTASATKWAFVLASTAPTKEGSSLWLCQSSKDLCRVSAQHAQSRPSTVQLPPDAEMRAYAACQDALWALDSLGQVFIRTLSASCPTGMHWARLDLSQLGAVKLTSLACGNQHVWACDSRGGVYFRVGTQPLNPSLMLPAWIAIEPPVQPAGVTLVSVHCSPDDQTLWALDSRWNVHVRAGITEEMPVGTDWEHVPGSGAGQAAAIRGLSDRRQQASVPILPGWGPHQQSTASQYLGFIAGRSFPDRQGLWSNAHSRIFPADGASFPGAPALCRRGLGGRRLSGRVSPSLLHPGPENRRTPRLPLGLQACQLALSTRTVWARCPNGDLARRYGISDKNPAGDYWKKIPGNVTCVTGRCWVPGTVGGAGGGLRGLLPLGWFSQTRPIPGSCLTGAQHRLCQGLPGRGGAFHPLEG
ncbi:tectonin beta-propeller repeat-containing protein 2 isoform X4 [Dama dama]|uniref:tectonin beta-propeller repeat-containing protein 2 isoform X4 n=1 Tax=Dama dama TaxID=30532 RepID=UPI002A369DE1|nr:tectonin beta-propeller repeat-containing protein 2 isoform X4 [Dama dama]